MPPGNRLAPPSPNYLQNAGQFVGGVGRGLSNQFVTGPLSVVQQSWENPYALGQGIVMGAQQFAQDPVGSVKNSLREMWTRAKSSPAGLGEVVGENIDPRNWLKPRKALRHELDVYHGTPHTFEPEEGAPLGRFRSSKIGTGEGAQAYGYGLYFAESPDVAGEYRDRLSTKVSVNGSQLQTIPSDSPLANAHNMVVTNVQKGLSPKDAIAATKKYWTDAANEMLAFAESHPELAERIKKEASSRMEIANSASSLKPESFYRHPGSLYTVDLPDAKIEQMLDWDKPLLEQPQLLDALRRSKNKTVQSVMAQIGDPSKPIMSYGQDLGLEDGQGLMRRLSYALDGKPNSPKASALLQKLGVPGVKYLDAGSRAGEKGTRNFVVFPGEEQHLNILSRD